MVVSESLATVAERVDREREGTCPGCGGALGLLPEVRISYPVRTGVRRCPQCGARRTADPRGPSWLSTCEGCALPFLTDEISPRGERQCTACREGAVPMPRPDAALAAALEGEVRAALTLRWRFVTGEPLQGYLDRIARQVSEKMEEGLPDCRVSVIDSEEWRTLALPSGTLLASVGLLASLEDEAELAFILGHEAAHAASGDAAARLARLGLFPGRAHDRPGGEAWAEAAEDLLHLGHGRRLEGEADRRALEALRRVGYDPESVVSLLERVRRLMDDGDGRVAAYAVAHPTPKDRAESLGASLEPRGVARGSLRVNRELFRRVLRLGDEGLVRASLVEDAGSALEGPAPRSWTLVLWIGAAAVGLAILWIAAQRLLA